MRALVLGDGDLGGKRMQLDDFASLLAESDFFSICDEEQRRFIAFASEARDFAGGDYIYQKGDASDGAFVLIRGEVAAGGSAGSGGKTQTLKTPGTVLGELGLVLARPRRSSMQAISNVATLFVPRSAFVKLMKQYPIMAERAAAHIARELDEFLDNMAAFSQKHW